MKVGGYLLLVFIFFFLVNDALAWKRFWRGKWRAKPEPLSFKVPPDQWFDQKLDHFNIINIQTWKQVMFTLLLSYISNFKLIIQL